MAQMPKMVRLPLRENFTGQWIVLVSLALLAMGVVMVHSALGSVAHIDEAKHKWYNDVDLRHTMYAIIAAVAMMTLWRVNVYRLQAAEGFQMRSALLLGISLTLGVLVFVPGVGYSVGGFYRWIRIGQLSFQPSELIKLTLVIFLAAWLTRPGVNVRSPFKTFVPALLLISACMGLVITQDFGTAMLIAISAGVTLLLAGVPWYYLISLVGAAGAGFYFFVFLSPYRWGRVMAMFDPMSPTNKAAYQAKESLLAIANGGWWGMGIGNGMIKQGFLPEDSTDFIFSVFCEEWGVRGAFLLMSMFLVWMLLCRRAALRAQNPFGRVLAGSLGFLIALQAVLHIGVDLVVLPPKGLGLPFVSAGGTSLIIMAAATSLIVSVTSRRTEGEMIAPAAEPATGEGRHPSMTADRAPG